MKNIPSSGRLNASKYRLILEDDLQAASVGASVGDDASTRMAPNYPGFTWAGTTYHVSSAPAPYPDPDRAAAATGSRSHRWRDRR